LWERGRGGITVSWHRQAVRWPKEAPQQRGPEMSITQTSLAEILREHVTLEAESIDRMYLNIYIPKLQRESGASWFLKQQRQSPVASSAAMAPISRAFVEAIETYAKRHQVPLLTFEKGKRKDSWKTLRTIRNLIFTP